MVLSEFNGVWKMMVQRGSTGQDDSAEGVELCKIDGEKGGPVYKR